ncbi:MAG: Fis family transcriptional regulator [Gammaproteobacteria bacterium]|nr:Fis family transcriptional regulator [Gammaproteobacteria bacterium]
MTSGGPQAAILAATLTLSACAVGPHYKQPAIPTPRAYHSLPPTQDEAPLSRPQPAEADLSQWWTQFHDARLEGLIERALQANLDLQAAASRIRQAREQELIAGAGELPSVSASGFGARIHSNSSPLAALASGSQSGSSSSGSSASTLKLYSVGFDATWEADVFGATRRGIEAARANTEAAVWQLRDGQVSLSAEVANTYMTLRTTQSRIAILRESTQHQRELLDLAAARAHAGFVTELDVNQQRSQLSAASAQLPLLEAQERASVHALGVLLGLEPDAVADELAAVACVPSVPTTLPVGLPSDLLRRRPDVRRAERQLASATAEVGIAVANLYPKFNLLAAVSLASSSAGNLFQSRSLSNVEGGIISWPVFQGGKLRANVRATREQQTQAYLAYRKSVLAALQDAEDALTRYAAEQRRLISLQDSQAAASSSLHIAAEQYRAGLVTFINVLTASATLLNARDQVAQSQQTLAQNLVSLYKALGGGWNTGNPANPGRSE